MPHPTPYTLHPTPYTLHPTPYTLHPTPFTLHPTPCTRLSLSLSLTHTHTHTIFRDRCQGTGASCARSLSLSLSLFLFLSLTHRDWYFNAKQPASASHMLRTVLHTVPRVARSYEHFPDGFGLHLLSLSLTHTIFLHCCGGAGVRRAR